MSLLERRLHPRRELRAPVIFEDEFGDGLFYVYSKDISAGGILLESDIPARLGSMVFLSFHLPPHKRPVRATGEVMRSPTKGGGVTGIGVRFVGLTAIAIRRLHEFLEVSGDHGAR